ncbi:MAG: transcriptional repressor [Rhodospirillaceae bacterium]|nr:transcriptional repressor [Rhodospirillaceae bacterium]MYH38081.1 transcriptional repressor [Rhodospirillaceae bacterium]MYK13169.1 transcriptional repressor [Rhodospirillaceae bacterium]
MGVMKDRPFAPMLERLRNAGLRPTRQRLALARLLFEGGNRHVTAEQLHAEARREEIPVSLATIYNTLNQFRKAGLLREVVVDSGRSWFDTNLEDHHHFFHEATGALTDFEAEGLAVEGVPRAPAGTEIDRVEVIVRLRDAG